MHLFCPTTCCSIEYIEDITAELRLLLRSSALPPQERLRVLLTAVNIVLHQVGLVLGSHSLLFRVQLRSCRPAQWLPAPFLQGGSVVAEHEGFYSELYAGLKHIMLSPVLDSLPTGSHGRDQELSDDEWFNNAAAAARAHAEKIGDQVMRSKENCPGHHTTAHIGMSP